jgi:hypothetical protein
MYKLYLLKYFGTFTIFIDSAMIEFQKHQLNNHSNTTSYLNQVVCGSPLPQTIRCFSDMIDWPR